jgi:hypothetical protein
VRNSIIPRRSAAKNIFKRSSSLGSCLEAYLLTVKLVDELKSAPGNADKIRALRDELERLRNLIIATRSGLGGSLLEGETLRPSEKRKSFQPETITNKNPTEK